MYDIYLSLNNDKLPKLAALATKIPILAKQLRQTDSAEFRSGFLGLNLSGDRAAQLLEQLALAGAKGFVVPVAYRQPKITREMAQIIASEALDTAQKTRFPTVTFDPIRLLEHDDNENPMWWKFGATSPEWIEQGMVPGVFYILIDKLDGHIWSTQEQISWSLHGEEYYLESATTLSSEQVLHLLSDKLGLEWARDSMSKNQTCLKGAALVVKAFEHTYPAFIEQIYGLRPTVQLQFRIIPYQNGYELATSLMLQAVMRLLCYDLQDAVLLFNAGDPIILLKQIKKKLVRSTEWDHWAGSHLARVLRSYELHQPQNGTLTKHPLPYSTLTSPSRNVPSIVPSPSAGKRSKVFGSYQPIRSS